MIRNLIDKERVDVKNFFVNPSKVPMMLVEMQKNVYVGANHIASYEDI
jgi:hypothetical protein